MPRSPPLLPPNEILALFIAHADPDSLPAISLVSRLFHQLAFPLVHCSVSFKRTSRIKQFVRIVKEEDESAPLRVSQALRRLSFCRELNRSSEQSIDEFEDVIIEFKAIVPKLIGLEHLSWTTAYYHELTSLCLDFRRWCPRLHSVEMFVDTDVLSEGAIMVLLTLIFLPHLWI
jgi:hypothetical protein